MSERPIKADVEALADSILPAIPNHCCEPGDLTDCPYDAHDAAEAARAVLASDWLAAHDAQVRREAEDRWMKVAVMSDGEAIREAQAFAWDVGYLRGTLDATSDLDPADNPYRTGAER